MKILGLDVASVTGFCLYEGMGRGIRPRVSCGLWTCYGDTVGEKCGALGYYLGTLLKEHGPIRYAAVEAPKETLTASQKQRVDLAGEESVGFTNAHTLALTNALVGAAEGVLGSQLVSCRRVADGTWRKAFIGVGRAPKHLRGPAARKWLKAEARFYAEKVSKEYGDFHIPASRDSDASEAVGVAIYLRAHVLHWIAEDELRARQAA